MKPTLSPPSRAQPSATDKRQTLLYLLKKHALRHFVETGTYRGDTVAALSSHVESVNTIELDEKLFLAAQQRFSHQSHIKCWHGCSGKLLGDLLNQCKEPALISLDGHYSGGITALADEVSPILREILHVAESDHAAKHVILIDDVRLFDGKDYPLLSDTLGWIARHLPQHKIEVYLDRIFVEPQCDLSQITDEALALGFQHAPRKIISDDGTYQLLMGENFDRVAAWKAGFQDSDCVSAVYVSNACNLGNSIQQFKFALGVAMHHGLHRVYLPCFWWLNEGSICLGNGIEIINAANMVMSDEEVFLVGDFFDISGLREFSSVNITHAQAIKLVNSYILVNPNGSILADNHLVIHIRAGGIFTNKKVYLDDGQPPLSFYLNILNSHDWKQVTLVSENGSNPVWRPLINHCKGRFPCEVREGMALRDDIGFLLRASTFVPAYGTFASGISCLSPYWKKVITFDSPFPSWGNHNFICEMWSDQEGIYREKILSRNWRNTSEQRDMMLNYPSSFIILSQP